LPVADGEDSHYPSSADTTTANGTARASKCFFPQRTSAASVVRSFRESHAFCWLMRVYPANTQAKIRGATIVASLSMMNLGALTESFPHVIFSLGTAPL